MGIHPDMASMPREPFSAPVAGFACTQKKGTRNRPHAHDFAQLFHVVSGSAAVETELGTYFVPPERALWIPPKLEHRGRYLIQTDVRFLYVNQAQARALPATPQVLHVTTLLRELILEFMSYPRADTVDGPAARIGAVILDQLRLLPAAPLTLPMPRTGKLRAVCQDMVRCPSDSPSLAEAAARCAMSVRSFERRMKSETGMSYRTWSRQVKLFRALELLSSGRSVSDIAHKLGYQGPSAFVATFRKAFGVTPGRYFTDISTD
ncbi:MAG: helix-turn-helix transcriptional regulator [Roseibium sp.]|nr:helix-turn-helix transcriptional regulator [Roseibium sp.]